MNYGSAETNPLPKPVLGPFLSKYRLYV